MGENISKIVRVLMALHEMDQDALGRALGCDASVVSKTLRGKRRWSLDDIVKLAEVFDRPISYFFEPADTLVRNRCFRQEESRQLVGSAA